MATHKRNIREEFLFALVLGAAVEGAAKSVGISKRTAYRWLADPAVKARLCKMRSERLERSSTMLTVAGLEAVKTLLTLQAANQPAPVRLGAARSILDFGMRLREHADFSQRLAELEAEVESIRPTANRE
ncbi:MAG TPA: hypothetical protein VK395_32120 [Gemmataceae bacterium]|nr:hypothetical protein [Gemmataceae bacterium]